MSCYERALKQEREDRKNERIKARIVKNLTKVLDDFTNLTPGIGKAVLEQMMTSTEKTDSGFFVVTELGLLADNVDDLRQQLKGKLCTDPACPQAWARPHYHSK